MEDTTTDVPADEQALIDPVADPEAPTDADPLAGVPSQPEFDVGILREMLANARRAYSVEKARWYLVRIGIPDPTGQGQNHPNQIVEGLGKHAKGVAELERLLREGMPPPLGGEVLYLPGTPGKLEGDDGA